MNPKTPVRRPARLFALFAGLALGTGGSWFLYPAAPASSPSPAASSAVSARAGFGPGAAPALLLPPILAAAEADAALDAYLALPPLPGRAPAAEVQERLDRLQALLTVLPGTHFARLFATLATRTGAAEARLREAAFAAWTESDAPAAARWAVALVPGEAIDAKMRAGFATDAALAWAGIDFDAAYAWAGNLADTGFARNLAGDLLARLTVTDAPRALALARAGGEEFYAGARGKVFASWAEKDPAAALRTLGPEIMAGGRDPKIGAAIARWAALAPEAALAWALAQPVPPDASYNYVLGSLARGDNPGALGTLARLISAREDIPQKDAVLGMIFRNWTRRDLHAALGWVDTVPDLARRNDFIEGAAFGIGSDGVSRFEAAFELLRRLPPSAKRDAHIARKIDDWASADPDAALAWLKTHDEPEFADAATRIEGSRIARSARTDPAAALARWQALPSGQARTVASQGIASAWSRTDPGAAARWLDSVSSATGPDETDTFRQIAERWNRIDPLGLAEWADQAKNPALAADALTMLNNTYHPASYGLPDLPRRAERADLLTGIKNPVTRENALTSHLRQWLADDLASAQAWIETHDTLSPEAAARLLTEASAAQN